MLSLTVREGGEIVFGDPRNPIGRIRIVSIKRENTKNKRVRVAFDFPREITINRGEVAAAIVNK